LRQTVSGGGEHWEGYLGIQCILNTRSLTLSTGDRTETGTLNIVERC
jgi:hypothetical protein